MGFIEIFEIIVIGGLIFLQIGIAIKLASRISIYKTIFDKLPEIKQGILPKSVLEGEIYENIKSLTDNKDNEIEEYFKDKDLIEVTYLKNNSDNIIFKNIVNQLNTYLIKNRGATIDFHLIKDTVERNTEIIEDEINNRIPAPLYIGLAATMIGIIFGLWAVNFDNKGDGALDAIQPLINGVKIAMSASVIGLIITTFFSVKTYKDANLKVEEEKNNFLSQLQSNLLPKINQSKLPEVAVLSEKLDHFARTTNGAIAHFTDIVQNSSSTIAREQELLNSIKALNVKQITEQNLKVFNRIDEMMGSFKSFAKYYDKLDQSMGNTVDLLQNLKNFVKNTQDVNLILDGIKDNIQKSNDATEFFNKHIKSFETYNDSVNIAVADNNSQFNDALAQLKEATQKQAEAYIQIVADYDSKMTGAFDKTITKFTESFSNQALRTEEAYQRSVERFTESMSKQVQRTEEAFEAGRPRFEKLDHLDKLDVIENRLMSLENKLANSFESNSQNIVDAIKNIKLESKKRTNTPRQKKSIDPARMGFMDRVRFAFGFYEDTDQKNDSNKNDKIFNDPVKRSDYNTKGITTENKEVSDKHQTDNNKSLAPDKPTKNELTKESNQNLSDEIKETVVTKKSGLKNPSDRKV